MNKKYFIAILLPERLLGQVEALKQELLQQFNLKGAMRSPAHITLHRPFEWKEEKEEDLVELLKQFKFEHKFEIVLQNFNCFEPRVIYVDVMMNENLNKLHKEMNCFVQEKLHVFGEANEEKDFRPHVTIAFRDLKKQMFNEVWNKFRERSFFESFSYGGFTLLKLDKTWQPCQHFL